MREEAGCSVYSVDLLGVWIFKWKWSQKKKMLFRQRKERSLKVVLLMIQMDSSEIHVLEETLVKNHAFALVALEKDTPNSFVKCSIPIEKYLPGT